MPHRKKRPWYSPHWKILLAPMCHVCLTKQHVDLCPLKKRPLEKHVQQTIALLSSLVWDIKARTYWKQTWTKTGTYKQLWKTAKRVGGIWDYDDWILCSIDIRSPQQKPVQSCSILSGIIGDWEIWLPVFLLVTFLLNYHISKVSGYSHVWVELRMKGHPIWWATINEYTWNLLHLCGSIGVFQRCEGKTPCGYEYVNLILCLLFSGRTNGVWILRSFDSESRINMVSTWDR